MHGIRELSTIHLYALSSIAKQIKGIIIAFQSTRIDIKSNLLAKTSVNALLLGMKLGLGAVDQIRSIVFLCM